MITEIKDKTLEILIENVRCLANADMVESNLSVDQIEWLTEQAWVRCRFKRMVSVQPMQGPCALAYYLKDNGKTFSVKSEGVAAKTLKYQFSIFDKADFECVKEAYADAMAADLECFIFENLPHTNYTALLEAAEKFKLELGHVYDYIIGPERLIKAIVKDGTYLDAQIGPTILDKDSFDVVVAAGKYPQSQLDLPLFLPYILLNVGPRLLPGTTRSALFRVGWYNGENNEKI